MKIQVRKMGKLVGFLSFFVLLLAFGAFYAGFFIKPLFILAGTLILICLWVYMCWTPVSYEIYEDKLTIFYRIGSRTFTNVKKTLSPIRFPKYFIKMWANGGLFALAGLFWSKELGTFYAYTSTTEPNKIVSYEGDGKIIFISPELKTWNS
mgnify:CR=1 FL=1